MAPESPLKRTQRCCPADRATVRAFRDGDPGRGGAGTGRPACASIRLQPAGGRAPVPAQPRGVPSDNSASPGSPEESGEPSPMHLQRREPRPPRPPLSKDLDRMPPPHPRGASGHLPARPAPRKPGQGLSTNRLELPEAGVTGSSLRNTLGNSKASREATLPEGGSHHGHCIRTAPWQGLCRPPVWTYPPFMQGVGWRTGAQSAAASLQTSNSLREGQGAR